ncbi:uncharacterized protein LOC108626814 [Ceratina calcarata]|uniref:Uncharacterized protein LOC108626814 n=1 Tax=Ceratina calcarata TaxID=156304 RepID=A0AAJ7J3A1_9HYME|nr:uncharacterized protein LOC108626814 [Ceratina calcarata]
MRDYKTSVLPLSSKRLIICGLMVLIILADVSQAKRGCSAFGHSCYGGHGKRFDPQVRDNVFKGNDLALSNRNRGIDTLWLNNDLAVPEQKVEGQPEMILQETRRLDTSKLDNSAMAYIMRLWVMSHQLRRQRDAEFNNK